MLMMISMMLMLMFTWPRSGSLGSGLHTDSWLPKLQNLILDHFQTILWSFCNHCDHHSYCTLTRGCRSCKILSLMRPFWDHHIYWDDVDTCDWWRNTSKYGATMARYQFTCLWEVPQSSRGTRGSLWSRPYHTPSSSKHTSCTTLLVPHFYLTVASVGTIPHFFLTVAHFILIPLFWPSHSPPFHSFRL